MVARKGFMLLGLFIPPCYSFRVTLDLHDFSHRARQQQQEKKQLRRNNQFFLSPLTSSTTDVCRMTAGMTVEGGAKHTALLRSTKCPLGTTSPVMMPIPLLLAGCPTRSRWLNRRRSSEVTVLRVEAAPASSAAAGGEGDLPGTGGGGSGDQNNKENGPNDRTPSGDDGNESRSSSLDHQPEAAVSQERSSDVTDHEDDDDDDDDDPLGAGGGDAGGMELRDFRARLMSKGLDGWGIGGQGEEGSDGGGGAGTAGAERSERWAHPLVRPELGCLVVAKENMFLKEQQYFYRAVALVIQHGDDGTVALILNRPTTFTMGDVCTGDLLRVPGMEDNVLYMGGHVAGARDDGLDVVNLMHGREDVPGIEVVKGLRLGGLKEALDLVAKGEAQPEEFKFFSRYSGWGPGQLEAEVLSGAWELAACDLESVLQCHNHPDQPGHFWSEIMSRLNRHRGATGESP